jgi:cysteine-rich repeat protein
VRTGTRTSSSSRSKRRCWPRTCGVRRRVFPEPRALLTFHDASGAQVAEFGFPSNPVLGPADPDNGGHSVLIATQAFADLTGLAPDFLMPPDLPTQDGMVCFTDNPENSVLFEVNACLSYGNYAGPLEQDACAGDNGSPAAALVIAGPTPLSLDRFQNDGPTDAFGCHVNADFELHSPEPRNTAGETATIAPLSEIEQGENLFNLERFNGNGRTCASCHLPEDDFGITPQTIASLFASDPADALFVAENNPQLSMLENACLMREGDQRGLILENIDGFENPPVFRNSPHLLNIALTAPYGLSGHVPDLIEFSEAAVLQHAPRMLGRNTDPTLGPVDVRLPTDFELQALQTFQDAIVFPADGNLSLTRMINFHIQTNGADSAAIGRGFSLFFGATGSAQCFRCHSGPVLASANGSLGTGVGNLGFNTGVSDRPVNDDDGCQGGPGDPTLPLPLEQGGGRKFNIPPLVGVARTAPFFHDNSAPTLLDAVAFYDSVEFALSPAGLLMPEPVLLTAQDIGDIAALLEAVSVDPGSATFSCGDGTLHFGEQCDDGNNESGDGCGSSCQLEIPLGCGNGTLDPGEECDDGNNLPGDCCAIVCTLEPLGQVCTDANGCTDGDTCNGGGLCVPGPALECDDGNSCTADSCDPLDGCVFASTTDSCDDGDACTTLDFCTDGVCGGTQTDCSDGNICTDDTCDAVSGCLSTPNVAACEDGNACTSGDVCADGSCAPGTAVDCDDGNTCTTDSCEVVLGCVNEPIPLCGCGNGLLDATEECDDGNQEAGDGCAAVCLTEPGFDCVGEPSQCATLASLDMFGPADALVTRDVLSGLDWLDTAPTLGLSAAELLGGAGGWLAAGWRHATTAEVCLFLSGYALAPDPCPHELEGVTLRDDVSFLSALLGATGGTETNPSVSAVFDDGASGPTPELFGRMDLALISLGGLPPTLVSTGAVETDAVVPDAPLPGLAHLLVRDIPGPCGDLDQSGLVNAADLALYREQQANPEGAVLATGASQRCSVIGSAGPCDLTDIVVIRRTVEHPPLAPAVAQVCSAEVGDVCGNGLLAAGETCDDGNTAAGDGCDALCGVEAGFGCAGEPSVCTPS